MQDRKFKLTAKDEVPSKFGGDDTFYYSGPQFNEQR